LTREWAEGHTLPGAGRGHRSEIRFVGVELFQIESHNPARIEANPHDAIQIALALLSRPGPANAVSAHAIAAV
jgi:hypothetical protein